MTEEEILCNVKRVIEPFGLKGMIDYCPHCNDVYCFVESNTNTIMVSDEGHRPKWNDLSGNGNDTELKDGTKD